MAKEFQTAIILGGGIAGQCCDISVGPLVDDVIDILLPDSSPTSPSTLQINAAINLVSTGPLGGPKELFLSGIEQPGRFFAFSVENTDLAINPLTVTAGISINGIGPSLTIMEPTDYIFFHCHSGVWKAWVQDVTGIPDLREVVLSFSATVPIGTAIDIQTGVYLGPGSPAIVTKDLNVTLPSTGVIFANDGRIEVHLNGQDLDKGDGSGNGVAEWVSTTQIKLSLKVKNKGNVMVRAPFPTA